MGDNLNRPMTGIRGAGYPGTAAAGGRGLFDPLNQATRGTGSPGFEAKKEETPEDKIKGLEKKVKTKEINVITFIVISTQLQKNLFIFYPNITK